MKINGKKYPLAGRWRMRECMEIQYNASSDPFRHHLGRLSCGHWIPVSDLAPSRRVRCYRCGEEEERHTASLTGTNVAQ